MEKINANDVLLGVLSYIPEESRKINYNYSKISSFHSFFFKYKSKYGVLKDLMFDTNGNSPFCEELSKAYSNLTLSGLVQSSNLSPGSYEISETCNINEEFSDVQKEELRQISEGFQKEFCLEEALSTLPK